MYILYVTRAQVCRYVKCACSDGYWEDWQLMRDRGSEETYECNCLYVHLIWFSLFEFLVNEYKLLYCKNFVASSSIQLDKPLGSRSDSHRYTLFPGFSTSFSTSLPSTSLPSTVIALKAYTLTPSYFHLSLSVILYPAHLLYLTIVLRFLT